VLIKLDIIVVDEHVRAAHLIEKTEPGQVAWL
jgi:hypothetical protein